MTHKRFHANCITTQLINLAKVEPKLASIMCTEATRLKIAGKIPLHQIIQMVGATSAAQYDIIKSAQSDVGFKPNSTNSQGPGGGVPDKEYPQSAYGDDYESCLKGLQALSVDPERAADECSTQWKGQGNRGGKWWTTPTTSGNPINAVVSRGSGNRIAVMNAKLKSAGERIREETREYYSQSNASVSSPNSNQSIPSWIVASGTDVSHLRNATSNINLRGAALDKHIEYMEAIHKPIYETLRNRAEHRDNQSRLRNAKTNSDLDKPYWAILAGY